MTSSAHSVTVLMPVHNAEKHLAEAVESILNQTFSDFELLCVDDGSTDTSPEILARYAGKDDRIRIIRNEKNNGIALSLNRGLKEAHTDLIARMDSDDASLPTRLALQVAFMAANPDVLISSGGMALYETDMCISLPTDDATIRIHLLWKSPFCHPAVIFRRTPVLEAGGYDTAAIPAEDYELWTRLAAARGWRFANLDTVLLRYRTHPGLKRDGYLAAQREKVLAIAENHLLQLGLAGTELDRDAHAVFTGFGVPETLPGDRLHNWRETLIRNNKEQGVFEPKLFAKVCRERMYTVAVNAKCIPLWAKTLISSGIKQTVKKILFAYNR